MTVVPDGSVGVAGTAPVGVAGTAPVGIDAEDLAQCLAVLEQVADLPDDHPDSVAVQRAVAGIFKAHKQRRRRAARDRVQAADKAVIAATATGSDSRIDDETAGIPLVSSVAGAAAGTLLRARGCYICKQRYTVVDAFYHQLCPTCAAFNRGKRDQRTDLTGRRALLTGGRAKIGMYIALRLLRDGADTTITTRFPRDAVRRFSAMPDSADWLHRLSVVGIDLRDPGAVASLADDIAAAGPLDIIINNAAQTVRRAPGCYSALVDAESEALPEGSTVAITEYGREQAEHPALLGSLDPTALGSGTQIAGTTWSAQEVAERALVAGSATATAIRAGTAIDAGGLTPDPASTNSWVDAVDDVDPLELLEVQLCNSVAPFILVSRLRKALAASPRRRTYVVNVSAMEGQFGGRRYKGAGHPHTNMAKAALNMLTRTSATEMFDDGILMTAVDTGWITDERPQPTKLRLADEGFRAPLDLVDGAARVYDPIVRGEAGEDLYGCFLKDYRPCPW